MAISVIVNKDGQIVVYEGTTYSRTIGFEFIAASTDGETIAGLKHDGQVILHRADGSVKASLLLNPFVSVSVSAGQIMARTSSGTNLVFDCNGNFKGQLPA